VTALVGLRHENIDRLLGVSSSQRPFHVITELCDRGTLRDCLSDGSIPADNVDALFDVCIQVRYSVALLSFPHGSELRLMAVVSK